jgi:hypothetical protein
MTLVRRAEIPLLGFSKMFWNTPGATLVNIPNVPLGIEIVLGGSQPKPLLSF